MNLGHVHKLELYKLPDNFSLMNCLMFMAFPCIHFGYGNSDVEEASRLLDQIW
jgi:hypothetical protein